MNGETPDDTARATETGADRGGGKTAAGTPSGRASSARDKVEAALSQDRRGSPDVTNSSGAVTQGGSSDQDMAPDGKPDRPITPSQSDKR